MTKEMTRERQKTDDSEDKINNTGLISVGVCDLPDSRSL